VTELSTVSPGPKGRSTALVVGVGLMGGSLAAALRRAGGWHLVGLDADADRAHTALEQGFVDEIAGNLAEGARDADLIVLATPVRTILSYLDELGRIAPANAVVIDLGSSKLDICAAMDALPEGMQAIGGHPMAGKQTAGVAGADPDLYAGRKFVLVETRRTTDRARQLALALVEAIGAVPVWTEAERHDRAVAMVSHIPHFLSLPLLRATDRMDDDLGTRLAAGGFRGVAAAADDNLPMWKDIAVSNRAAISAGLREFSKEIEHFADLLDRGDRPAIENVLEEAARLYREDFEP